MKTKNIKNLKRKGIRSFKGLVLLLTLGGSTLFAQKGLGTATPLPEAALEVSSPDKGVLFPKIGLVSSTHFLGGVTANANHDGMLVYNTNTATNVGLTGVGYYIWQGGATGAWVQIKTDETVSASQVFSAEYAGAALYADGADNTGFLTSDNTGSTNNWMNFYHWSNTETDGTGTNDYDIILRFTLPADFEAWETPAIEIDYAGTADANFTADVYLETSGTALASLAATSGTAITTWSVANIAGAGLTTLGAGDTGVLVLHLTATDVATGEGDSAIRVGDITLNYTVNK